MSKPSPAIELGPVTLLVLGLILTGCGAVTDDAVTDGPLTDAPATGPSPAPQSAAVEPMDGGEGAADDAGTTADTDASLPASGCATCDGSCEETVEIDSATHVNGPIDYPDPPPAGGIHGPCWADYGRYDDPPLPAERWVHNLEHGAVVFLYRCDAGCDAEVAALGALADELPRTIVTPYPDMPEGFAVVAWGFRLVLGCLDIEAMRAFYNEHFDRAPESVGGGAPAGCP